jgi:hypothetical protein
MILPMVWWLASAAVAAEGPLYTTDWTSGVDGSSRSRVAQVVRAHEQALLGCLDLGKGRPVELSFEWKLGKPVGIEAKAPAAVEVCVESEIARWRADVKHAGPYRWELATSGEVWTPTVGEKLRDVFPAARLSGDRMLVVTDMRVPDGSELTELARPLRGEMPAFSACVEHESFGDVTVAWTADGERLHDGRLVEADGIGGAAARCLVAVGEGLPFEASGEVEVRFSLWKLDRELLAPEEE